MAPRNLAVGWALACASVGTSAVSPAKLPFGQLTCTFSGWTSVCHSDICVNDPIIYRHKPVYKLTLDFGKGLAALNGVRGRIIETTPGKAAIAWDMPVFGTQELVREQRSHSTSIVLRSSDFDAGFAC